MNNFGIDNNPGNASGLWYNVTPGFENKPVRFVSWYDSIRFANWLHNGQGNGDTETGAYTLTGGTPTPTNGNSITRNAGATVFLTSENEWYKAAYYKGVGTNAGYWDYSTQTDAVPISDEPPGTFAPTNSANYFNNDGLINGYNDGGALAPGTGATDVGAYAASVSAYGTFDQTGNAMEWNESFTGLYRGLRGEAYDGNIFGIPASSRGGDVPTAEPGNIGFRVATTIPEPGGLALMCLGLPALLRRRARSSAAQDEREELTRNGR